MDYNYNENFTCDEKHLEGLELSNEFYEKVDEMIAEEAKEYIKSEIKFYKQSLNSREEDIKNLTESLKTEEKNISELKRQLEDSNIMTLNQNGKIEELELKIESMDNEFLVGENCFYIDSNFIYPACPECKDKQPIKALYNGKEIDILCPVCKGEGELEGHSNYFAEEKVIRAIQFDSKGIEYAVKKWDSDWKFENKNKFYKTKEEAQKKCDEINKKRGVEE